MADRVAAFARFCVLRCAFPPSLQKPSYRSLREYQFSGLNFPLTRLRSSHLPAPRIRPLLTIMAEPPLLLSRFLHACRSHSSLLSPSAWRPTFPRLIRSTLLVSLFLVGPLIALLERRQFNPRFRALLKQPHVQQCLVFFQTTTFPPVHSLLHSVANIFPPDPPVI